MREVYLVEDILNNLIELETIGNRVYKMLSENARDIESKKLFSYLAAQEEKHKKAYEALKLSVNFEEEIDEEYEEYLRTLIKQHFSIDENQIINDYNKAIEISIQLEKDTILFLSEMERIIVMKNSEVLEMMKNEERKHLKYLYKLKSGELVI